MRASWLGGLATLGLVATIGTTGGLGCGSRRPEGFTAATRTALPLGAYPASARMTQEYGIVEWRVFAGRAQLIVTGFRADGSAARGVQLASFKAAAGAPAHVRLMMLDGSGTAIRRTVTGAKTGTLSALQNELVETMRYDMQRAPLAAPAGVSGSASDGTGIHLAAAPAMGVTTGVHLQDFPGGTSPGSGPQCTEAWNNPSIPIDGSGCILGAATFEDVVGGVMAIASCSQWYVDTQAANATCSAEDSASCNSDNPPTCNFNQGSPEAAAPAAPQSQCDSACLCANYPDTAQGCSTNFGPCTSDNDCSGGYTCQAGEPGASANCKPPQADGGAGDDAGATGDDGGAGAGDDGGGGAGDDGGGNPDPTGDDGGGSSSGGDDTSGDDGGADDPNAPPTDQQVDDSADNTTCASCQGAGSDLSADPQNGDVAVTPSGTDTSSSGSNPSTSDTSDDPAGGGSSGGGSSTGSSTGGSSTGSSSTGSSSGDDPGQSSQDQSSQDQSSQDQSSQDQSSQDQSSQDQSSQDQGSQDQGQDAQDQSSIRRRHHGHKASGWSRLYDRVVGWFGG